MKKLINIPIVAAYLKFVSLVNLIAKIFGGLLLCVMSCAVFMSVVSRFIPGFSVTWVEELVTYGMAWICVLGAGLATRKGEMTAVTLAVNACPLKLQKVLHIISCLVSLIIFVVIIRCGYQMALIGALRKSTVLPSLTMFWLYIGLPAGVFIMIFNTIARIIEMISDSPEKEEVAE